MPSKFDMAVFVSETDKGIAGSWVYSCDLFDATTIARMAGMYQLVLEKATVNPAMRLSGLLIFWSGKPETTCCAAPGIQAGGKPEVKDRKTQVSVVALRHRGAGAHERSGSCRISTFHTARTEPGRSRW